MKTIALKRIACAAAMLWCAAAFAGPANFEFVDQSFADIFYALSQYSGTPIVGDETVTGNASFRFAGTGFEKAFASFLRINRLYLVSTEPVWTVSRIRISVSAAPAADGGSISLDALDASPAEILERISRETGRTIVFEILPATRISIHVSAGTVDGIASLVMKPFPGYAVEDGGTHLLVKRSDESPGTGPGFRMYLQKAGGLYSAEIRQARFSDVIERLCAEEGTGYSNFMKSDPSLSGIRVSGKSFDELLGVLLEQSGAESFEREGVRYFVQSPASDPARAIRERESSWKEYAPRCVRMEDAVSLVSRRFPAIEILPLGGTGSFLALVNEKTGTELSDYLGLVDRSQESDLVCLRYISTADFLKVLPPSVRKDELTDTGTGNSLFYRGPPEMKKAFLEELGEIDRPKARLRYDMLIIQYDRSEALSWGSSAEIRQMKPGDMTAISGSFGNLLNLNFDVITLFGYQFSARLNAALSGNSAQVFADTTLHGISGETIKFQNTSTYRYRDSNVDPETGKPVYTGITREIVSGVVLEINGWVSGDGMVTMTVNALVSKRGADVSSATGNPPPTSERSITTRLSSANGEPVILTGLTQNDSEIVDQRTPFISRIPLLGWLFRSRESRKEKTEMVIYLVPHITNGSDADSGMAELRATAIERLVRPWSEKK